MLLGDPSLGFMSPQSVPGVPGDVSTARFTGTTKIFPVASKIRGLTAYGSSLYIGGENEMRRYSGDWGGPLATYATSHNAYVYLNYPTITSAKILVPGLTRLFWTNTAEYAWSATIPFNTIGSLSFIGQNTSFPARVGGLCDMTWDRYGSYAYMTDYTGQQIQQFDISDLNIAGTVTPPQVAAISMSAYGTPYCTHLNLAGTKLYVAVVKANGRVVIEQFSLPTPYMLTGAVHEKTSQELESGIVIPGGLTLAYDSAARDSAWMLVADRDSRTVYEYSMSPV